MVAGHSSLAVQQAIDNLAIADAHRSFSTQLTTVFGVIEFICSVSTETNQAGE